MYLVVILTLMPSSMSYPPFWPVPGLGMAEQIAGTLPTCPTSMAGADPI